MTLADMSSRVSMFAGPQPCSSKGPAGARGAILFVPGTTLTWFAVGAPGGDPPKGRPAMDVDRDATTDGAGGPAQCALRSPVTDAACGDVPATILRENCVGAICHHA